MFVKKYHDTHCEDKEVLITIRKAIDAGPELRSKKELIEAFLNGVNDVGGGNRANKKKTAIDRLKDTLISSMELVELPSLPRILMKVK